TIGRWRSFTCTPLTLPLRAANGPKSRSSSSREPYTSTRGYSGLSDFHTGIGEPQNRFRLIDQSRALASHLPNEPSRTCAGVHSICWFSSTMRSRNLVTATNHEETAL